MKLIISTGILLATLTWGQAQAGDVLHLRAGDVRPADSAQVIQSPGLKTLDFYAQETRHFVVQFKSHIQPETRDFLESQGFELRGYLPDDALIIKGTEKQASLLNFAADVQAVVPFTSEWKISPELLNVTDKRVTLLVSVLDTADAPSVQAELARLQGVQVKFAQERTLIIRSSTDRIADLAKIEGIEWIQEYPIIINFDFLLDGATEVPPTPEPPALNGYESGTRIMNFEAAWNRGYFGEGQIVGMADTGVDTGVSKTLHSDLTQVIKGIPMGYGADSWNDPQGHGTHVCGSVVGNGTASNGVLKGGAHKASMVVEGLWSPIMGNLAFPNDPNTLMGAAYKEGVRVHTNSWGSPSNLGAYDTFASNMDRYTWNNPDMLILFAAGNSGEDKDKDGMIDEGSVSSPGTAKNVLTVGASENYVLQGGIQKKLGELRGGTEKWGVEPLKSDTLSNNPNGVACFSSRGPTTDGRLKPEIVAPGTNIISTRSHDPKAETLWGAYNSEYVYAGGTSMSTPLTAGAATVTREYLVKAKGITNPSGALVKATLIHTAKDLYPGQYGTGPGQELRNIRPNNHEGYGRVDMDKVTDLAQTQIIDETAGVDSKNPLSYSVTLEEGHSLRATLTYTDAPGTTSASKALVNDLDLEVVSPSGQVSNLNDHTNNTEMLELANLHAGSYQVRVKGVNIPQGKNGKQPFALLITQY